MPGFMEGNHVMMGLLQMLLDYCDHGHQSEVFYQWISESVPGSTQHGYAGGTGGHVQRLATVLYTSVCYDNGGT